MKKQRKEPYICDPPSQQVTLAIKSLASGTANEDQQKTALNWILYDLCGTYDLSYRPDNQRNTDFAEGKRFVGLSIIREINIRINQKGNL